MHLHVHTEYSLLDGSIKLKELMARVKTLGMGAVAITDHGSMFGVIDFYKAAKAEGIKPIIGCELYVASGSRHNKEYRPDNFYYHIVLLAKNNLGYQNLVKLVSLGYTEGFYYRPRVDLEILQEYSEGLICLSACLAGPVAKNILNVSYARALQEARTYMEIYGKDNFFLEMQNHGIPEQNTVNEALVRIGSELGLGLVATNDSHYLTAEDAKAHEVLVCIQTGKTLLDEDRLEFSGDQFYIKSADEMEKLFGHLPEALENTSKIADCCDVEITFNEYKLPKFDLPKGRSAGEFLREITYAGLEARYGEIAPDVAARADYELGIIGSMGFDDYFLVTWDFIDFAHKNGIAVGPGRGSGAGSVVAYALRITNVDPLKFDLIFERFLNPERISMPDIDTDFCYERRQEVIDYVVEKYGKDRVAQIITFGTMGAKAVVRDVGRALAMPYAEVDAIAKMIPFAVGMTIERAMEINPDFRKEWQDNERARELIDMARRLEGLPRHASTHAAGVVISDVPLTEHVPLNQNDGVITTQFPMDTLEELGLLKMDFLGLRTLTVIKHTEEEVKRRHGLDLNMEDGFDMSDQKVFDAISAGRTEGMFQLESRGMTSLMKELKPTSIGDLAAGVALFRPGPMEFIPKYVRSKHSGGAINYTHPALEPILRQTYGCIVYQEQVTRIVRDLAGYSLGRSDLLRRAMSKKKADVMEQEKAHFIHGIEGEVPGCVQNGIPLATAEKIFEEMADFAKYAFPEAHAVAYAMIAYQTAWLKTYYPTEFMAALMTSVMDNTDKVAEYIGECKKMGLTVLPPDVNESLGHFSVISQGKKPAIRFGLNAIKNLGRPTVAAIVAERQAGGLYKSLSEFISRLKDGDLNKRGLESMIKAGAFTSFGGNRCQYINVYEKFLTGASNNRKYNVAGQLSLSDMMSDFGGEKADFFKDELPNLPEFPLRKLLEDEKEVMGIYVSGHPVLEFEEQLKKYVTAYSSDFVQEAHEDFDEHEQEPQSKLADGQKVTIGGIIAKKNIIYTRRTGDAMCFVAVEDIRGTVEAVVFPNLYKIYGKELVEGRGVVIEGKVSLREDQGNAVICDKFRLLGKEQDEVVTLWLKIPKTTNLGAEDVLGLLSRYGGDTPVVIYDEKTQQRMRVVDQYRVNISNEGLISGLQEMLGADSVVLK